jgi:diguanylate cyclase (GGDEF)-like protein
MRGDADTPAHRRRPLSRGWRPDLSREWRLAAGLAVAALAVTLLTGGVTSPALALLAAALAAVVRFGPRWLGLLIAGATAAFLTAHGLAAERGLTASALAGMGMLAAGHLGWLWAREAGQAARRQTVFQQMHAERRRELTAPPAAAGQGSADLLSLLEAVATDLGARAAVLWHVEALEDTAWPRATAGRSSLPRAVPLGGTTLGWCWAEGVRLRADATAALAEPDAVVMADRVRRDESGEFGEIVTYVFPQDAVPDDDRQYRAASVRLRSLLQMQEATARAEDARARLDTLVGGIREIPGQLELSTLADNLCHTAMDLVGGTGAVVATWDGEAGRILAVAGDDGGPATDDEFRPPGSELAQAVRAQSMIVRSAGEWRLGDTVIAHPDERWERRPRALAALPLRIVVPNHGETSRTVGVLAVWTSATPAFEPQAIELLHALSPYAAMHLDHASAYDSLKESAGTDPLTGLQNRRAFDEAFQYEAGRFERYRRPTSLLMLDLDFFKAVNDTHGHEAGDEVLRRTASIIRDNIRQGVDQAARLGGEEFVVLMPETPLKAAMDAAERIRLAVAAAPIYWNGTPISVRMSIGASCAPECVASPHGLISSADAALYLAKESGRNRVVAAEPERRRA